MVRVRLVVLALVASVLALLPSVATAEIKLTDGIAVPVRRATDAVMLPGGQSLVVTGPMDPLAVVDLQTGEVRSVPTAVGLGDLSLDDGGTKLYGATGSEGSIVEVDLVTWGVRTWNVGLCPHDPVERQGFVYYVADAGISDCSGSHLRRLDPRTGSSVAASSALPADHGTEARLVPVPGMQSVVLLRRTALDPGDLTTLDASENGSLSVSAHRADIVGGSAFLTEDGSGLVVGTELVALPGLAVLDDALPAGIDSYGQSYLTTQDRLSLSVLERQGGTELASYRLGAQQDWRETVTSFVRGSTLYAVWSVYDGGTVLYRSPAVGDPVAETTFSLPYQEPLYVDDPVHMGGRVTLEGVPVEGATITLTDVAYGGRRLGTVVSAADGTWEFDTPAVQGGRIVEATLSTGDRVFIETETYVADRHPTTVTSSAPDEVPGGSTVEVSGTLETDGTLDPDGEDIRIVRTCLSPREPEEEFHVVASPAGAWRFTFTAGPCDLYETFASFDGSRTLAPSDAVAFTDVARRQTSLTMTVSADRVFPGTDLTWTAVLKDDAGRPLPDTELSLTRYVLDSEDVTVTRTTDDDGQVRVTENSPQLEGRYCWAAQWEGDAERAPSRRGACAVVGRNETGISLSAEPALVDGTVHLQGTAAGMPLPAKLELRLPDGTTRSVDTFDTGYFTADVPVTDAGLYRYEVAYAGDAIYSPAADWVETSVDKYPTTLSIQAPDATTVGVPFHIRGQLSPVDGPSDLALTGPDGSSTALTTDADGHFDAVVTHAAIEAYRTWTVSYAGDRRHDRTSKDIKVWGVRPARVLTLRTDRSSYTAGQVATFFLDIDDPASREVQLVEVRPNGSGLILFQGDLPAGGLEVKRRMSTTYRYRVHAMYAPPHHAVELIRTVGVRLGLATTALSPLRRDGTVAVYSRSTDPVFRTTSSPARTGACMRQEVQRRVDGGWRAVATSTCRLQDSAGVSQWRFTAGRTPGRLYRVRSAFAGDSRNLATRGPWTAFRFR